MSVDKNNLSEAIELLSAGGSNFGPYPEQYYDQYELVFNAAKKYAALEPLLRELCEARKRASEGEWCFDVSGKGQDAHNVLYDGKGKSICDSYNAENSISMYEDGSYIECGTWDDFNFMQKAANITARIREVVDGK